MKYTIKSTIVTHDNRTLKYKQWLVIHEPPVQYQQNTGANVTKEITTCCCCDQGKSSLGVTFQKNIFYNNEVAWANVGVDNSNCELDI